MAEFWTQRNQITKDRLEDRCGAFDREMQAGPLDGGGKLDDFRGQKRLAAGNHNVTRGIRCDFAQNLTEAPWLPFGAPRRVWGVAPGATEIAAGSANKYGRHSD